MGYILSFIYYSVFIAGWILNSPDWTMSIQDLGLLSIGLSLAVNLPIWILVSLVKFLLKPRRMEGAESPMIYILLFVFLWGISFLAEAFIFNAFPEIWLFIEPYLRPLDRDYNDNVLLLSLLTAIVLTAAVWVMNQLAQEDSQASMQTPPQPEPQIHREPPRAPQPTQQRATIPAEIRQEPPQDQTQWAQLTQLSLVARKKDGSYEQTNRINSANIESVWPVAVIYLRDNKFAGYSIPLEFNLVTPDGIPAYSCRAQATLQFGKNVICPNELSFEIRNNTRKGAWSIRLWCDKFPWYETAFSIQHTKPIDLRELVGNDMEVHPSSIEKVAETIKGKTLDELLASL